MQRPLSITVFAALFGFAIVVSLLLALYALQTTHFSFRITPEAAHTLTVRIMAIRALGIAFALWLMLLVVFGRSRGARSALGLRWLLGLATSVAFLHFAGMIVLTGESGMAAIGLSVIQLIAEGFAVLILYGEDAAEWFERRLGY